MEQYPRETNDPGQLYAKPSMKAVAVSKYGGIENLVATEVARPERPQGHDLLVKYRRL